MIQANCRQCQTNKMIQPLCPGPGPLPGVVSRHHLDRPSGTKRSNHTFILTATRDSRCFHILSQQSATKMRVGHSGEESTIVKAILVRPSSFAAKCMLTNAKHRQNTWQMWLALAPPFHGQTTPNCLALV